jgi:peptidoglycan L-alanyl-D-glutamate endopeptidase CwlK
MSYFLSKRSYGNLEKVDKRLFDVVETAIQLTTVDFGVIQGLRTVEEQEALVAKGASKTMKSKHLEGLAVDLMAYIGSRGSWELSLYDNIADAIKAAAGYHEIAIRWGGAWHIPDIRKWGGTMEEAMNSYIDLCRAAKRRPFIDGPHFELSG